MKSTSGPLFKLLGWLITLVTPFAIILTAVRLLLTPIWLNIEYRMPGFPADPFGFTLEERLRWANVSLEYLLNDAGIEYFDSQRFSDGVHIYEARELQHLVDVKNVVSASLLVWYFSISFLLIVGLLSIWGDFKEEYRAGVQRGAWLTIGFVAVVLVFVIAAFGIFFVYFHEIFFDPGTWTFSYADTLIRLFPERFWQDAFLWIGGLTILISLWLSSLAKKKEEKNIIRKRSA